MKNKVLLLLLFITGLSAFGQEITIYDQFLGKYDFTMFGNTMNPYANGAFAPCVINTSSSATLNLEPDQEVVAAYLYWAGSGASYQFDNDIKLNGTDITAERFFSSNIAGRGVSGAFADVTDIIQITGNGNYTVSDFDLTGVISPYCPNGTNFGGWAILIVYESPNLTNNLVNVYDGFTRVDSDHTFVEFQLDNLNIFHLVGNKIAFLAWEGDADIAVQESLKVNGNIVGDPPLNPPTNIFNSTNTFTNSNTLYNMDLDWFDVGEYTSLGDNTMTITMESHQDAVILNALVVTLNSEVPDATIDIEAGEVICDSRDFSLEYTVYNTIATDALAAETPIAFYANDELIAMSETQNAIPIGGSEDGQIDLSIPDNIPNQFTLRAQVNDDGTGESVVIEFNLENNSDELEIYLGQTPEINSYQEQIVGCDTDGNGFEIFDLTEIGEQMQGGQTDIVIRYYESQNDAEAGNDNNIADPENYQIDIGSQTIWIRLQDPASCNNLAPVDISVVAVGELDYSIPNIEECAPGELTTGIPTDLTVNETAILNGNDPNLFTITYHLNQADAMAGENPIPNPENYVNEATVETIWVRLFANEGCGQFGSFELIYHNSPEAHTANYQACFFSQQYEIDLTDINELIVTNTQDLSFTYYPTEQDAENQTNNLPVNYAPPTQYETIYVRVENEIGCYKIVPVELEFSNNFKQINDNFTQCSNPYDEFTGFNEFDLTEYSNQIKDLLVLPNSTISFYLTKENAENNVNAIPNPENYTNTSNPQTLYARADDLSGGCGGIAEFTIEILPVPEFSLDNSTSYCNTEENKIFEFEGSFESMTWYNPDGIIIGNGNTVEFTESGIHTLEITQPGFECPARRDIDVIFIQAPEITGIEIIGTDVKLIIEGGTGPFEYSYNEGLSWTGSGYFENLQGDEYIALVRSETGCYSEPYPFTMLMIPNLISPNDDGVNDSWRIRGLEAFPDAHIKIFDRYGKIFVDRKITSDFEWDGKYMGRNIPSGDYWYIITADENYKITGHITVKNQ